MSDAEVIGPGVAGDRVSELIEAARKKLVDTGTRNRVEQVRDSRDWESGQTDRKESNR